MQLIFANCHDTELQGSHARKRLTKHYVNAEYVICQVKGGETFRLIKFLRSFFNHLPFSIVCQQKSLFEGLSMGLEYNYFKYAQIGKK